MIPQLGMAAAHVNSRKVGPYLTNLEQLYDSYIQ